MAKANTDLSVANWHDALAVPRALGLNPTAAKALSAVVNTAAGKAHMQAAACREVIASPPRGAL